MPASSLVATSMSASHGVGCSGGTVSASGVCRALSILRATAPATAPTPPAEVKQIAAQVTTVFMGFQRCAVGGARSHQRT